MSRISVDLEQTRIVNERLKSVMRQFGILDDKLVHLRNQVDNRITSRRNIGQRLNQSQSNLEQLEKDLGELYKFIDWALDRYEEAERKINAIKPDSNKEKKSFFERLFDIHRNTIRKLIKTAIDFIGIPIKTEDGTVFIVSRKDADTRITSKSEWQAIEDSWKESNTKLPPITVPENQAPIDLHEKEKEIDASVPAATAEEVDTTWIPEVMQLDGSSAAEQYLAKRINTLNNRISDPALKWNQEKINELWHATEIIYDEYGIQVEPRLLLAIIFQEGTGSFNTSSTNLAADGQHGVETNFAIDLMKANNLVFGKILGYAYYGGDFNQAVASNNHHAGISGEGRFFQYANWNTPIIDLNRGIVRYGVYAGHGAWHEGVEKIYEGLSHEGASAQYSVYLSELGEETILEIANGITLPDVTFTPSQNSQDYRGNPNGEYTIISRVQR